MANEKWQMANGKLLILSMAQKYGWTEISVLAHFKQINPHQFPTPAVARQNIKRRARSLFAQLLSLETYISGKQIRIPLLRAQNLCAPDFWLRTHHAANKSD